MSRTVRLEYVDFKENETYKNAKNYFKKAGEVFAKALGLYDCFNSVYNSAKNFFVLGFIIILF